MVIEFYDYVKALIAAIASPLKRLAASCSISSADCRNIMIFTINISWKLAVK